MERFFFNSVLYEHGMAVDIFVENEAYFNLALWLVTTWKHWKTTNFLGFRCVMQKNRLVFKDVL